MRFSFANPWMLALAVVAGVLTFIVASRRHPAVSRITLLLAGAGLLLFALAAGGLAWHRPATSEIAVMVDLSASTRGADYRDPAKLQERIRQLAGDVPYRIIYFAQDSTATPPAGQRLGDLSGEFTRFAPPVAAGVLLFSDGRFEIPSLSPPVYPVFDSGLAGARDAIVRKLEMRGSELAVTVTSSAPRQLSLDAAATQPVTLIEGGPITLTRPITQGRSTAAAQFTPGDLWPENDALSLPLTLPMNSAKWMITRNRPAADGFLAMSPANLPTDPAAYLAPAIIVLDNLAAEELSAAQLARLTQYVRDLGGALVIGGGDRAFASGMYPGTALEALSPLASHPPAPTTHWMLLADASGSMSAGSRWQQAAQAIARLIPQLPPDDPVSVGGFARDLAWWSTGKSARETALLALPPAVAPAGPTNLSAALEQIAAQGDAGIPSQLLVITDSDVVIEQPAPLAAKLAAKQIRLHILAISQERGIEVLESMARATGGTLRRQLDSSKWAGEVKQMMAAASPNRLMLTATDARFLGDLASLGARSVAPWNRAWLKRDAALMAQAKVADEAIPLAGRWNLGAGDVVAVGFSPSDAEIVEIARRIARPPRDPRLAVSWTTGRKLMVRIEAAEAGRPLNDLSLSLEIADESEPSKAIRHVVPQLAPGRYELSIPAPRSRGFATLRQGGRLLDRIAVADRYAPEFDATGIDYDSLRLLAARSGGRVIDSAMKSPVEFPFPRREKDIAPVLAMAGAMLLAIGLAAWRWG